MTRVGFTLIGGSLWTGGQNYLLNLLDILVKHQAERIVPVLFVGQGSDEAVLTWAHVRRIEVVETAYLNASRRLSSLLQAVLLGRGANMRILLRQHKIDLIFENAQFFGWNLGIPAIAWIPDFQHRALPHLFTRLGWWKRELGFLSQVYGGRTIMLSSEDARRDCERFYPSTLGRTRTVHFAVPPGEPLSAQDARNVAASYGLPERFIFMPNQFWRHKNHLLVLEALLLLKAQGIQLTIAASGKQSDPRDPTYFPEFQAQWHQHGLEQDLRLLGLIPYEHIRPLMRASTAMLNASLFEGWSTTVAEAQALGTPMVLSNLDVHREQMGDQATYFDRCSAQSLADALARVEPMDEQPRAARVQHARQQAEQRVVEFAAGFADLAEQCYWQAGGSHVRAN